MRRNSPARLAAALLLALLRATVAHSEEVPSATLQLEPCTPVKNRPPLRCGKLAVPENWAKPGGRTIDINVVVVPAAGPATLPPLYDLPGGPGVAETASAEFWLTDGAVHRAHRDVVLIDQRGTGASHPLNCALPFADPYHELFPDDAVRACRKQLAADADLAQYSTDASVRDVDAVRAALGHERIDLSGLSYGTRFAQAYALAYPQRVRAMALIGTVPPDTRLPLNFAGDAQRAADRVLEACGADASCARAFPHLRQEWARLRAQVAGDHGQLGGRALVAGAFWEAFRGQLASTTHQRRVPWLIHTLAGPDPQPALARLGSRDGLPFSSGLLFSVECQEDTLAIPATERASNGAGTFLGNYRVRRQYDACKTWGLPPRRSAFRATKILSVPTLFLVGAMDYVAPPQATQRARRTLPNSRVVVIPDLGHDPVGVDHLDCLDRIIDAFFVAGSAEHLDTGCVATMRAPPFEISANSQSGP